MFGIEAELHEGRDRVEAERKGPGGGVWKGGSVKEERPSIVYLVHVCQPVLRGCAEEKRSARGVHLFQSCGISFACTVCRRPPRGDAERFVRERVADAVDD